MSQLKIDQAFVKSFIDGAFGLGIAHENIEYKPTGQTPYAELLNLPNDITPLSLNDSDETDGIFRIILRYPAGDGAVIAKTKAQEIMDAFPIGNRLTYSGQTATVTSKNRQPGAPEQGWYKIVVTIGYRATLQRN